MCAEHGRDNCQRCDTAVVAGDPRPVSISAEPLGRKDAPHAWWRPQPAEEYEPPACYACGGLARAICRNCRSHYCRDHSGRSAMCLECSRSARLGLVVFLIAIGLLIALFFLAGFVNR